MPKPSAWRAILAFPALLSSLAVAQVQLEFAPPVGAPSANTYTRLVQLPNGSRLFIGTYGALSRLGLYDTAVPHRQMALYTLGPGGALHPQPAPGGSGNDIAQAVAGD